MSRHAKARTPRGWRPFALHLVIGAAALLAARWQYGQSWPPAVVLILAACSGGMIFAGFMFILTDDD